MKPAVPFSLHHFSGNHHEIGLQHGQAFRKELQDIEHIVLRRIVKFASLKRFILRYLGEKMLPCLPDEYVQEMKGIAVGGKIPFETVYFLNLLPTVASCLPVTMIRKYFLNLVPEVAACSLVALSGRRTRERGILIGRNLDFGFAAIFQKLIRFAVYRPKGGHAFFTITFPGFIGVLTAYSEKGVFFCESSIDCSRTDPKAMPAVFLFRRALERAGSLEELQSHLIQEKRSGEFNVFLANRARAVHLELALLDYRTQRLEEKDILYAANHFFSKDLWRASWKRAGRNPFIDSRQRIFEDYWAHDPENQEVSDVAAFMKRLSERSKSTSQTVYSLVIELDSLTGLIACQPGIPVAEQSYRPFDLAGIFERV
ncbi:MAG: C45 family peptidase [bacterium]